MIKRLFWLTLGFGLGVFVSWRATRAVRVTVERYVPEAIAARFRALNDAVTERQMAIRARRRRHMRSVS